MQELLASPWTLAEDAELNEAAIRSAFQPADRYRISRFRFPAGTIINGRMINGTCVVLQGQCLDSFDQSVRLRSGQFAELPGGPYKLIVEGDGDLEIVLAWEIPQPDDQG